MAQDKRSRHFVASLSRGLEIIEAFSEEHPSLGIAELSRKLGLHKTTVFRLVSTLVELGFLSQAGDRKYRLSPKVLGLGHSYLQGLDLRNLAQPLLRVLQEKCGETVNMATLDGSELVYIERLKTSQIVNINLHIGSRLPLYNTSMGRVLIAFQPPEWIDDYIRSQAEKYPNLDYFRRGGDKLKRILALMVQKGYAINDGDLATGLRSIAAPVRDSNGDVVAATNVAVPSARISRRELESQLGPMLLETVGEISKALGYLKRRLAS